MDIDPRALVKTPEEAPAAGKPGRGAGPAVQTGGPGHHGIDGPALALWPGLAPTVDGLAMGLAGLTGSCLHPEALIRLLS